MSGEGGGVNMRKAEIYIRKYIKKYIKENNKNVGEGCCRPTGGVLPPQLVCRNITEYQSLQ